LEELSFFKNIDKLLIFPNSKKGLHLGIIIIKKINKNNEYIF